MVIHFIASSSNLDENIDNYRKIIDAIKSLGHTLARDWVEEEFEFHKTGKKHISLDWNEVADDNSEALARSDVVIAEASGKSFSTGFQIANAIQLRKPVLILTHNDSLRGTYGSGIKQDFVEYMVYSPDTLEDIISDFLVENELSNKDLRFNFFITQKIYNYLRWASYKTRKSKSEILRELIEKEIDKKS